jgi:putative copper export protein
MSPFWWGGWAVLSLALLASTSFAGHASVAQPRPLALLTDVVHLAAGATWFTGIVFLAIVLPDAWISKDPVARLSVLAPAVLRFSQVALVSIAVVAVTGTLNSFFHVGRLADMTTTTYGQTLTIKIVLFLVILALGGLNHFVLRKRFERALETKEPTTAHRTFRKTIAIELAVAVGLMAVTGALVGFARTKGTESARPAATRAERL